MQETKEVNVLTKNYRVKIRVNGESMSLWKRNGKEQDFDNVMFKAKRLNDVCAAMERMPL